MTDSTPSRLGARLETRAITTDPRLRVLTAVVESFRSKRSDMPMQMAHTLLAIAARPGVTMGELIVRLRISQTSVSRNIQMLSDGDSKGAQGMGLVSVRINPNDYRARELHLSTEGRAFLNRMLCAADGEPIRMPEPVRLSDGMHPAPPPSVERTSKSPWAAP